MLEASVPQLAPQARVPGEVGDRGGETGDVVGVHEDGGVARRFGHRRRGRRHHGGAARHRLHDGQAEALVAGGVDDDGCPVVEPAQLGIGDHPGQDDVVRDAGLLGQVHDEPAAVVVQVAADDERELRPDIRREAAVGLEQRLEVLGVVGIGDGEHVAGRQAEAVLEAGQQLAEQVLGQPPEDGVGDRPGAVDPLRRDPALLARIPPGGVGDGEDPLSPLDQLEGPQVVIARERVGHGRAVVVLGEEQRDRVVERRHHRADVELQEERVFQQEGGRGVVDVEVEAGHPGLVVLGEGQQDVGVPGVLLEGRRCVDLDRRVLRLEDLGNDERQVVAAVGQQHVLVAVVGVEDRTELLLGVPAHPPGHERRADGEDSVVDADTHEWAVG